MAELDETTRQRSADVSCANDPNLHGRLLGRARTILRRLLGCSLTLVRSA